MIERMRLYFVLGIALVGCVESPHSTMPRPELPPVLISGPPSGEADPGFTFEGEFTISAEDQEAKGDVDDETIEHTLDGYGEWVEDDEYGRVWRPYPNTVGVNFTPYETAGSWVATDDGWTYASDWDWGWLAFHYGQWAWLDDDAYWCWVPDYTYSPAWVDWRTGGGYVGWTPTEPRRPRTGPTIRDHRTHPSHWTFVDYNHMGAGHIHPHVTHDPANGLSVTQPGKPAATGVRVSISTVMGGRFGTQHPNGPAVPSGPNVRNPDNRPRPEIGWRGPSRNWHPRPNNGNGWGGGRQPSVRNPDVGVRSPDFGVRTPDVRPPSGDRVPGRPSFDSWQPSVRSPDVRPPMPPQPTRPTTDRDRAPMPPNVRDYHPSRPEPPMPPHVYSPPSPRYEQPSRNYDPPSRSYDPPASRGNDHRSNDGGERHQERNAHR